MSTINDLRDRQAALLAEARSRLDAVTSDTPAERAAELEAEHDKIMAEYDALEARAKREAALEARERAMSERDPRRPSSDAAYSVGQADDGCDRRSAFLHYIRGGTRSLSDEERAALNGAASPETRAQLAGTPDTGGYAIAPEFDPVLQRAMILSGPMLDPGVVRIRDTATGAPLTMVKTDDTGNEGVQIPETSIGGEKDIALSQITLGAYQYSSQTVKISTTLLQDSAFDFEREIIVPAISERIGRIVNRMMTLGTGSNQPTGIVTASPKGLEVANPVLTSDNLVELYHAINPIYRSDPTFKLMCNDSTLLALRKLKDGQGNYLFSTLQDQGGVINIAGISVPYVINPYMPDIAPGMRPIVMGAFGNYTVRRVKDIWLTRLSELYMEQLLVGFVAIARFDGALINDAAVRHLAVKAK